MFIMQGMFNGNQLLIADRLWTGKYLLQISQMKTVLEYTTELCQIHTTQLIVGKSVDWKEKRNKAKKDCYSTIMTPCIKFQFLQMTYLHVAASDLAWRNLINASPSGLGKEATWQYSIIKLHLKIMLIVWS